MDTVDKQLGRIEAKLDTALDWMKAHEDNDKAIFYGSGENNPGLIKQVDRLTEKSKQHKWLFSTVVVTFITAVGDKLWHFFQRLTS